VSRKCPICASSDNQLLYEQSFKNSVKAFLDGYSVVSCDLCGFIFADNIPSQEVFNEYYGRIEKYEFNYGDGRVSSDYGEYFKNVFGFIDCHVKNDKNIKILDIGCASGDLLNVFKENGYGDLLGIEPSVGSDDKAHDLYGVNVINDSLQNIELNEEFDLIILSAVLEHLVDISEVMGHVNDLLKDNGLLFIEVPDVERFHESIPAPFQQFNMEHVNFFSEYSLKNLMSKWGLDVVDISFEDCVADSVVMPDLYLLSRKTSGNNSEIMFDVKSNKAISRYIEYSEIISHKLNSAVVDIIDGVDRVMVWGVGTHTKFLLDFGLNIEKVSCFIDSNSRYKGGFLNGVEIIEPNMINQDIPILISSLSYHEEIEVQIRSVLKLENKILNIYH